MRARWIAVAALGALVAVLLWLRSDKRELGPDAATPQPAAQTSSDALSELVAVRGEPSVAAEAPASAEAVAPGGASLADTAPAVAAPADVRITLYGVVRPDASREALRDGNVAVAVIDELGERVVAQASSLGDYSISGLRPGNYWLRAGSTNDGKAHAQVELTSSEPARRLDLQLALPNDVWIKVVDPRGAPHPARGEFFAAATREAPGEWLDEVRGSLNNPFGVGQYWQNGYASETRGDEFIGRVVLNEAPPVWISLLRFQRVFATQRVTPGQREVVFELADDALEATHGALRVRFVAAQTREPLTGAEYMLDNGGSHHSQLDDDGVLEASKLSPGWCTIRVQAKGLENGELRVRLEPGVATDLGEIALQPESSIRGEVVDENGAGLELTVMHVALDPETLEELPLGVRHGVKTDGSGVFRIGGLSARVYRLQFESPGSERARTTRVVDLRRGNVEGLHVEVPSGTPLVLSSYDDAWRGVRIQIVKSDGERVLSSKLWGAAPWRLLLAPGAYNLLVSGPNSEEAQRRELVIGSTAVKLRVP